jgi:arylsulfatase A-like enzyme
MNFRNGTGWDTHNDGQLNQHLLIQELDVALTTLMRDLESKKMLDKTLIVINSEFGRPAQFDSGGGRGHHSKCFSMVLAGGGLNHRGAYGTSDELAMKPVDKPVSVPDAFATILAGLQIDPTKNLYDGDRPVPITDQGQAIDALF